MYADIKQNGTSFLKVMQNGKVLWEKVKSRLPVGYQECKWLECHYQEYIVTEFIPRIGDEVEVGLRYDGKIPATPFYSTNQQDSAIQFAILIADGGRCYTKIFTTGTASAYQGFQEYLRNTLHKLTIRKDTLISVDGVSLWNDSGKIQYETNSPLWLMARENKSAFWDGLYGEFIVTRNGKTVFDAVPCLDNNGIPCMYDTASQKTYYNQGTGQFGYELL